MKFHQLNLRIMIMFLIGAVTLLVSLFTLGSVLPALIIAFNRFMAQATGTRSAKELVNDYYSGFKQLGFRGFQLSYGFIVLVVLTSLNFVLFNDVLQTFPVVIISIILGVQIVVFHYSLQMIFGINFYLSINHGSPVKNTFMVINQHLLITVGLSVMMVGLMIVSFYQLYLFLITIPLILVVNWMFYQRTISVT